MANEIQLVHDDAAETIYAIIRETAATGKWYDNTTDHALETFDSANWATYAITLAQVDVSSPPTSGNAAYQGTFPALAAGFYWLDVYVRAGATAAQTDYRVCSCLMYWNGSALTPASAIDGAGTIDSTGGSLTLAKAVEALLAWSMGKCVYDAATGVATYYGIDGTTIIVTTPLTGGGNRSKQTIT